MNDVTIAGLAAAGDVGIETVRFYQRRGLMPLPDRAQGGGIAGRIRRYGAADIRRLRFIRAAQAAGFTLDEIGDLLRFDATEDRPKIHDLATQRLTAIDAQIASLRSTRAALARLADRCGAGAPGPCPIVAAFEDPPA